MELYKKHRPKKFEDLIGQSPSIKSLVKKMKSNNLPHTLLLTGPSGCGKTTVARILKRMLNCSKADYREINTADHRSIEDVREINRRMRLAPSGGDCRIWLIDEAHKLSNDAQNAFLKILEDTPKHVYFILATTRPEKLIKTIHTRSTQIDLKSLSNKDLEKLLLLVSKREQFELPKDVCVKIVENSDGSARKALVFLDQVIELDEKEDMLTVICKAFEEEQGYKLAFTLLYKPHTPWKKVAQNLKSIWEADKESAEGIRWVVLGFARGAIYKDSREINNRACQVIEAFRDHFYDSKHAGLAAACYEVVVGK